jgi:tetratricopeptide (TPR) repeat protein
MTTFISSFLIVLCLLSFTVSGQAPSSAQLMKEAQACIRSYKDGEALIKYEQVLAADPTHFQALCQAAVLKTKIGARTSDENKKRDYFLAAKDFADKAYDLKPNDAEANYVLAVCTGGVAIISSTRQKLAYAFQIKNYLDKALQLNPKHAGAWHVLGRWHYKIANLSFAEIATARMIYGGVPEGATTKSAIDCFQKAIQFDPGNIIYYYDLARVYEDQDDEDACKATLQMALDVTVRTSDELEVRRHCRAMLAEMEEF